MAKKMNFVQAINLAMHDAMEQDDSVMLLGEDVGDEEGGGVVKVSHGLSTKFGTDRVRSTPIAEEAIMGAAIGASLVGKRPIAEIMLMNFMTVAMDQIVNHAAKLRFMSGGQTNVPITIRTMTGAGGGAGGQHCDMLEAWFAHVAGIKVVVPSTPADAYGLLLSCIQDDDPCMFIENLPTYWTQGEAPEPGVAIPLGKANVEQEGSDVTVIGYGRSMMETRAAVQKLGEEGVGVELIDLRTVAPFDLPTVLNSVSKTKRAVIVHEAVTPFGIGAELSARITEELFSELQAPVQRVGATFNAVPYAQALEDAHLPQPDRIIAGVKKALN
ncbi:MAG: alpha-ketoacid dehydrogenase subunit beta [bacterium]